jgi:hypothetical protein
VALLLLISGLFLPARLRAASTYGVTITHCKISPTSVYPGQAVTLSELAGTFYGPPTVRGPFAQEVYVTVGFRDPSYYGVNAGGTPQMVYSGAPGPLGWSWSGATTITAPSVPGTYYVWVQATLNTGRSNAEWDFATTAHVSADAQNAVWSQTALTVSSYGVTMQDCTISPNPANPGQTVTLSGLQGTYYSILGDEITVTIGLRQADGTAVGIPAVVQNSSPATYGWTQGTPLPWTVWGGLACKATITAPSTPGSYYVWVQAAETTKNATAEASFESATPTSDEPTDYEWTTPLTVSSCGATITACTINPNPAYIGLGVIPEVSLTGLGGLYQGSPSTEEVTVTVGFRDEAGYWAGGAPQVVTSGEPGLSWAPWADNAGVTVTTPTTEGIYYVWVQATTGSADAVQDFENGNAPVRADTQNAKWSTPFNVYYKDN